MSTLKTAILFRRALGVNDTRTLSSLRATTDSRSPEAGYTEFMDCLNVTPTVDGCVERPRALQVALAAGTPVTAISAGTRFMYATATETREWLGGVSTAARFSTVGPTVHTSKDVRISGSANYRSPNTTLTAVAAAVGTYPGPTTTRLFSAMPAFAQAFVYNSKLYVVNKADPRFLQFSEDYAYDLFDLRTGHCGVLPAILQGGAIAGVVVLLHTAGVTVLRGAGPAGSGFAKRFYPCRPIAGTLASRVTGDDQAHVFLCDDGVYSVSSTGAFSNLTANRVQHIGALNTSYSGAHVGRDDKYTAFGNNASVEYDFNTKGVFKHGSLGFVGAAAWNSRDYYAAGSSILMPGDEVDTSARVSSVTLPFSNMSATGVKRFEGLYFTGTLRGAWRVTATDQTGAQWAIDRTDPLESVSDFYIKTPKRFLGNRVSLAIECAGGDFRLEELRAVFAAGQRSR